MPSRPDPRSTIVDGRYDLPIEVTARVDILKAMREYFWDLYNNDALGFGWKDVDDATLRRWSSMHINFYHEAEDLMRDCIRQGHIFDEKEIRKYKDYHKVNAENISSILISRSMAK